jgi:hypothetical protein
MGRRRLPWLYLLVAALVLSGCGGRSGSPTNPASQSEGEASGNGASVVSAVALAKGHWSRLTPPPGSETNWDLAVWTGKYVFAWGSTESCCTGGPSNPNLGSSEHATAFDPATGIWRRMPPAPVSINIESTIWTGSVVLVWGSTPPSGPGVAEVTPNVLLSFNPTSWRWRRLSSPTLKQRSEADVAWTGRTLIVFGGNGPSRTLLDGAAYDPATNRWTPLPALPRVTVPAGSTAEPVGTTAVWAGDDFFVWVTRQVSRAIPHGGEISAGIQALRWRPGTDHWQAGAKPSSSTAAFDATAVWTGSDIALLDGSGCLPAESCAFGRGTGNGALYRLASKTWSSVPTNAVLGNAGSFVWTGRALVVVSPYLTVDGYVVGGYAAAFDPSNRTWSSLPGLPVPGSPPQGATFTGAVWDGSELTDSGLVLTPGVASGRGSSSGLTVSPLPTCPPISFPDFVGGTFCGPAPGRGNGNGPDGSCLGNETSPPCGAGMSAGKYYAYTLFSACTNDYIDGRWWTNELPGGSGPLDVWMAVNGATGAGAGWIGPNGSVGFKPSSTMSCSP